MQEDTKCASRNGLRAMRFITLSTFGAALAALAACGGSGGGTTSGSTSALGTTQSGPLSGSGTNGAPTGVAAADSIAARVCACADAPCGQKVLDEAKSVMPGLLKSASAEERKQIGDARDKAFACMDKLVANDPAEKAAVGAAANLEKTACACSDQGCAEKAVAAAKEPLAKTMVTPLSKNGHGAVRGHMSKAGNCLAKLHFTGSTIDDFAAKAKSASDKVCACKSDDCIDGALTEQGKLFAGAFTPDDMEVVQREAGRASACAKPQSGGDGDKSMCGKRSDRYGPYELDAKQAQGRYGASAKKFADAPTTNEQPVEVCGVDGELAWLTSVTCADGSPAYKGKGEAHKSRKGTAQGGRCGDAILDRYIAKCPEKTYEVLIDLNMCGKGEKFQ